MAESVPAPYALLLATDRAEIVPVVEEALRSAGIPFQSGLQTEPAPRVIFSVPSSRLAEAQAVTAQFFGTGPLAASPDEDGEEEEAESGEAVFPWAPVRACLVLVAVHLALLLALSGPGPASRRLVAAGALVGGAGLEQPWRLFSYMFLHSDLRHVLWNSLSLIAFAVPLLESIGYLRTAAIYLASGVLGGIAALLAYPAGTVTVGSSGAVAGLFGAWLVGTLGRTRSAPRSSRARLKVIGIGLLVLPSLLTPNMEDGTRISVAAHVGGVLGGILLGLLLVPGLGPRSRLD